MDNIGKQSLEMHKGGKPGKIEIQATKPLVTQHDLSLAYSPGVAAPCLEIQKDPEKAYDYTARGNFVAVISNGTAVLGLGNLGALASKPVMEGKSVLFKRFAGVDAIDIELDTENIDEFVNTVRCMHLSFGGINLEDIKAPECFEIEDRLKKDLEIPVFHDDQHGTAIISVAALINALEITGKNIADIRLVVNGAGAAAMACTNLLRSMGIQKSNILMCDSKGVLYEGRTEGMNDWKLEYAVKTNRHSLKDAMEGADVFLGLSVKDVVTQEMVKSMNASPIIFAMANPDPEITPEDVLAVCPDAIVATGRSDYPNQVNNVLGFPYIFRGALDVRASCINEEMKIAAAHAIASLAREPVPDEVRVAYGRDDLRFGREYLIPTPFDPRLIVNIPIAVAKAAMDSGVAQRTIDDFEQYAQELRLRLQPTSNVLSLVSSASKKNPQRIIFAEGEEEVMIRAALEYKAAQYGEPILIGRKNVIHKYCENLGIKKDYLTVMNASLLPEEIRMAYADALYEKVKRKGYLQRDVRRMVNQDRNVFSACMLASGEADGMITGVTRNYYDSFSQIKNVLSVKEKEDHIFGLMMLASSDRTIVIADTLHHEKPTGSQMAHFAEKAASVVRSLGYIPSVAFISTSNFGSMKKAESSIRIREAMSILENKKVDFDFDGEMNADVALDFEYRKKLYPFSRLTREANVLISPNLDASSMALRLLDKVSSVHLIGPILMGFEENVQIVSMDASVSDIINIALMTSHQRVY